MVPLASAPPATGDVRAWRRSCGPVGTPHLASVTRTRQHQPVGSNLAHSKQCPCWPALAEPPDCSCSPSERTSCSLATRFGQPSARTPPAFQCDVLCGVTTGHANRLICAGGARAGVCATWPQAAASEPHKLCSGSGSARRPKSAASFRGCPLGPQGEKAAMSGSAAASAASAAGVGSGDAAPSSRYGLTDDEIVSTKQARKSRAQLHCWRPWCAAALRSRLIRCALAPDLLSFHPSPRAPCSPAATRRSQ